MPPYKKAHKTQPLHFRIDYRFQQRKRERIPILFLPDKFVLQYVRPLRQASTARITNVRTAITKVRIAFIQTSTE